MPMPMPMPGLACDRDAKALWFTFFDTLLPALVYKFYFLGSHYAQIASYCLVLRRFPAACCWTYFVMHLDGVKSFYYVLPDVAIHYDLTLLASRNPCCPSLSLYDAV
jgi:hypothetical protein